MTSNDYDMEQKKTLNAADLEETGAKQENGQGNVNFAVKSEIEDSDIESRSISRSINHGFESFASETQDNELIEANPLQEKETFPSEIQSELLQTINDSCLVAPNFREINANSTPSETAEVSNSLTDEFSLRYNGSTQLVLAPEQNSSFNTIEESRILDTEDLKALPLTASTASGNLQCSPEQIWPSSQENVNMFEDSEQNVRNLSTKAYLPIPSIESTAFISSSVSNNKEVLSLSQATETDQNSPEIGDNTVTTTSNENENTTSLKTPFREKSINHESIDFSKRRISTPNTSTPKNNTTCLPLERIDNNARASVLPQEIGISSAKQTGLSKEPAVFSKKAQILTTSRIANSEALFPSSSLLRSELTPGPRKNLEATLMTSKNLSMITQTHSVDENQLSPSIPPPRTHSIHDSFGSSPSSGVSIENTSSPTISEPSPERAKEILLAELKTIKIASITARNTALEAELASKRTRLEEIRRELKAPAQETVRRHIKLLHDYNDIRDIGQGLIGMIAEQRGVQIGSLYEDYGVGVKD
ncbi:hypothetical protein EPUL_003970 [Erysiphe pulchra]|uniref:Swi5-domain-containing protein n=1 Tax=Erysiphe pulchra TaxID=225359 RepID=A0A2S4PM87_9PEZI|nr:hypothetical protein EPUL_003970 [Erysiphe pulchra]